MTTEGYLKCRERRRCGSVYNPELGFALVGNTANGQKYPYNPFYGEFSPRIAVAWNPQFDVRSVAGKIFGTIRTRSFAAAMAAAMAELTA